jgi:hypothetical protein
MERLQAFAFAASCAERQWPVYERAAQGKQWAQPTTLRAAVDAVWGWLLQERGRPHGFAVQCERAILEEIEDDLASVASQVANSYYGLLSIVERDHVEDCIQAAKSNLGMIDAFLYEQLLDMPVSKENDLKVDAHELMRAEMARQGDDLAVLSRGAPMPSVVAQLRERSRGVSVLGQYWYD